MRNPSASIDKEPLKREEVEHIRERAARLWEDYWLATEPNKYRVLLVGDVMAMCDHLLRGVALVEKDGTQHNRLPV